MFTKPKHGWTEIHLEDFEGLGSYTQDVPVDVMFACIRSLWHDTPLELRFDEEGSAFTLTAEETTKIVTEGEFGVEEYHIKRSKIELIREIIDDMKAYFEEWIQFSEEYACFEDDEAEAKEELYDKRFSVMNMLIEELENAFVYKTEDMDEDDTEDDTDDIF